MGGAESAIRGVPAEVEEEEGWRDVGGAVSAGRNCEVGVTADGAYPGKI